MHVVLLADPEIPVPPVFYGGIERVVDFLARELSARGHRVTLFAHPDSSVPGELIPWRGRNSLSRLDTLRNAVQLSRFVNRIAGERTVIHSFARLAYMLPLLSTRLPKIQSYQRAVTPRSVHLGSTLSRDTLLFTACSESCASTGNREGRWKVVYNAVELSRYRFRPTAADDAPLMFLGKLDPTKGPHHAVEVARRTGRRLIVAGNIPEQPEAAAYARSVLDQCDGRQIEYVGPVDDTRKDELLGQSACLLMPIEWDEPFGIVMAEAMACGTPVIGFRRGSVPEVVEDERSGFVCENLEGMVSAVARLRGLDRAGARDAAEKRFSSGVIVSAYEDLYRQEVERA